MHLKMKGAASLFAVLLAAMPGMAAAENSPWGASSKTATEGDSRLSTGIATAMLTTPKPQDRSDKAIPKGDPFLPVGLTSKLILPPPRGRVIFEHYWRPGDVPADLQQPGGAMSRIRWIAGKFRVVRADGRYQIVTDPETGENVLDILMTREDEARTRTRHTEVEVNIPGYWSSNGRFMIPGERYLLEVWRKNIDYTADSRWEIWWQNHSRYDSTQEASRNPSIAIDGGRRGSNVLRIRSDSEAITKRDSQGSWIYDRDQIFDIGENVSDEWEFWQMELEVDDRGGALYLWRNGTLVHAEEGLPVGYNDRLGPEWRFGWYKYFGRVSTFQRRALFGPVRVQKL